MSESITNVDKGRSATIVAAYLMYAKGLDPTTELDLIRAARPYVECVRLSSLSGSDAKSWTNPQL